MKLHDKVLTTFYRRMIVFTRQVESPREPPVLGPNTVISELRPDDIAAYLRFRPDQRRETVERRLEKGDSCFAAWHNGHIVQSGWAATERAWIPYLRAEIILGPTDFYIYDSFTQPGLRGQGFVHARSARMHDAFRAKGFLRGYGVVALENTDGVRVADSAGYRRIGMYHCRRFGGWQNLWSEQYSVDENLPALEESR